MTHWSLNPPTSEVETNALKCLTGSPQAISRRGFLCRAVGTLVLASAARAMDHNILPVQRGGRGRETFDFGWKFFKGNASGAEQSEFPDSNWRNLDLPHDWSIEGPLAQNETAGGSGGYVPTGVGWYRKHFRVPEGPKDRKVFIEFDGVYENSEVWINGHYLGKRPFGYISFSYDLTPHLVSGNRENVVAVKVDNSHQPNSRWYSGSGIYRHTWLLTTSEVHVAKWGTFVSTPRISQEASIVAIKTRVRNERASATTCKLVSSIVGGEAQVLQTAEATQQILPQADHEFFQEITLDRPHLWSVDDRYLYRLRSTVLVGEHATDEYETSFGIRDITFDPDRGFLLNGSPLKLNGVCLHHDGGAVGAAVPERLWERRLEILKEMGCNAIRTSHNPAAPEFLDLCDRMGFLVMNEIFDEWKVPKGQIGPYGYSLYFDEWSERDVKDFVHRDRNHPSVVLWSAGNEIGDQTHPQGVETLRRLVNIFHSEDPTRLVTAGCDQIAAEPKAVSQEFLAQLDVVGYNYVDRWRDRAERYYSIDREAYHQRRMIGTESSGMGGVRGDYRSLVASESTGFRRLTSARRLDVEQLWKFVRNHNYVAGDFMWTGIDYLGESRWPGKSSSAGVLDTCGSKKDGYYFYQSQWTTTPMLHLFPHWNWKGHEGEFFAVMCYTNCDTVELFLNGKSLGTKGYAFPRLGMEKRYGTFPARSLVRRTTSDLHLLWDVPYEPGTLKGVGTKDGKVAVEREITTTGEAKSIGLLADRNSLIANRRDVAHVTAQVLDDLGRIVPDAENEITFEIQGEGKLLGLDNGNPESHEDYKSKHRRCFQGLCLAIVQSGPRSGKIGVNATSPGLKQGNLTITTAT